LAPGVEEGGRLGCFLGGLGEGQGQPDEAGCVRLGAEDFDAAGVGFGDFAGDNEAEAEADITGGKEGFRGAAGGFRGEAASIVTELEVDPLLAIAVGIELHGDVDAWAVRAGLEGIEHDFGDSVFEGGAVAFDDDGFLADVVFELSGLNGLELLGFLVSFLDEVGEGELFAGGEVVAGEEAHLVDESGDAPHAVGQGGLQ